MWTEYLREEGTDTYCPIERTEDGIEVILGMNYEGFVPDGGSIVGVFAYGNDGEIIIREIIS